MDNSSLAIAISAGVVGLSLVGGRVLFHRDKESKRSFVDWVNHLRQRKPRDVATRWVWEDVAKITWAWQYGGWGLVLASQDLVSQVMANPNKFPKLLSSKGTVLDFAMGHNRHTLNPGFRSLPDINIFTSTVEELISVIDGKEVVDIQPLLQRGFMDCVAKCLLDLDLHTVSKGGEFLDLFNRAMLAAFDPLCQAFPWLSSVDNPLRSEVKKELVELDQFITSVLQSNEGPAAGLMRQANFTNKQIRDNAMLLLLPSLSTSSTATMVLHHLARNPEIQQKAREEVKRVLQDGSPTTENINQLEYLSKVIRETMRMCPAFAQLPPRYASEDTTLDGIQIKKGTTIVVDALTLQRDPEYYPNPLQFSPDRVTNKAPFLSFGGGSRTCIGLNLAKFEMKVFVAKLLLKYGIAYPKGKVPSLDPEYYPVQMLILLSYIKCE